MNDVCVMVQQLRFKNSFFLEKKYSIEKNPEVGHTKLPKYFYFHPPPPSYFQILAKIAGNQLKLN